MADLIDRQAAIDALRRAEALTRAFGYHNVIDTIKEQPTIDAVEVVRCKDCKYFESCSWSEHEDDGFCKWGERGLADG